MAEMRRSTTIGLPILKDILRKSKDLVTENTSLKGFGLSNNIDSISNFAVKCSVGDIGINKYTCVLKEKLKHTENIGISTFSS
jgi:hypothetical protein